MHIHIRRRSTREYARGAALVSVCSAILFATGTAEATPPHKPPAGSKSARAAPPPHIIPDTGTLNADDLVAIAKLASSSLEDQYAEDRSLKYVGREFEVAIPCDIFNASSSYDKTTHQLTIETGYLSNWILARGGKVRRYIGQNAFGATTEVSEHTGGDWGLHIPGDLYNRKAIRYVADVSGDEAKVLKDNIEMRIYGRIRMARGADAKVGTILYDHRLISGATISNPFDVDTHDWLIAADISKLEWVDRRTGQVLSTQAVFDED